MATVSANVSNNTRNRFYRLFYSAKSHDSKMNGERFISALLDLHEGGMDQKVSA